jgi:hypothetical protein
VAIDDIALGHEVGAPGGVEDLLAGDRPPAPAREQVEQALLDRAQRHHRMSDPHQPVDDVELDLAELDDRDQRQLRPGRPPADDDRSGQELFGRERHGQDVVDPEIERLELRPEVAAMGQAEDGRHAAAQAVRRTEPLEEAAAVVVVHVHDRHVRAPVDEDRLGLGQVARGTNDEQPVVEGQPDEVDDEWPVVEDKCATRLGLGRRRACLPHGWPATPFDPGDVDGDPRRSLHPIIAPAFRLPAVGTLRT